VRIAAILLALIACAAGIQFVQTPLAKKTLKVSVRDDASALPPPKQLRAMTFGYRAAVANLLWAKLLVEHGLHSQERRPFEAAPRYLEGILELEPEHPMAYAFVDTLLVTAKAGSLPTEADVRLARAFLERGVRERPYDHDVWLHYGQFIAFIAPSSLSDEAEIQRWRRDGALAMARAVELGADADRSLAASTILSKAGEKKAAIRQLQSAFAITDDPETRRQIIIKLQRLEATPEAEDVVSRVEYEWRSRYPFLTRGAALLIGPYRSPSACAGPASFAAAHCAADWSTATVR
jgi:hypothetical protein